MTKPKMYISIDFMQIATLYLPLEINNITTIKYYLSNDNLPDYKNIFLFRLTLWVSKEKLNFSDLRQLISNRESQRLRPNSEDTFSKKLPS